MASVENSVISSFVYSNLLRADMHLAITILEAMAGVPSLAGLRMLVRLVSDQECNSDRKLVVPADSKQWPNGIKPPQVRKLG